MTKINLDQRPTVREQVMYGVVLLIMVIGLLRVVYAPQTKKIEGLKVQVASATFERDALRKFALPSPEKVKSLSRRKGVKIKILSGELVPAYQELTSLLAVLTQAPFLSGISVLNLSYKPSTQEKGYVKTEFGLNVRGSFTDILRYIEEMEQFPALFHLGEVNLKVIANQPQEVETEIQGLFYRLGTMPNPPPSAGKPAEGKKKKP